MVIGIPVLLIIGGIYFLPTIISAIRGHHNQVPILIVNIFFGWTLLGWIVALIWATTAVRNFDEGRGL